jgi:Nucleotidyl transferase of unknown function (DUF2204)
MIDTATRRPATPEETLAPEALDFYRQSMNLLKEAQVPFLVGGAYAFARYTGIVRHTKDFDVFVHPRDFDRALDAFAKAGYEVDRTFPHWLGKAFQGDDFVDVIFGSGNGVARVDEIWFERAVTDEVLGIPVQLIPAEEMIWSKSFIMERERFDGADVAHVLHSRYADLDWQRLLDRFDDNWRILLVHLLLFGYTYPDDADRIPVRIMDSLLDKVKKETRIGGPAGPDGRLCRGPILSRLQYLVDVEDWGYRDARLAPAGPMTAADIAHWTKAAREEEAKRKE